MQDFSISITFNNKANGTDQAKPLSDAGIQAYTELAVRLTQAFYPSKFEPRLNVSSPDPVGDAARLYAHIAAQQVSNANI